MAATLTAEKKTTKAQRLAAFKEQFICPFEGTKTSPFDLASIASKDQRPSSDEVMENLPTLSEYIKNRRSPVVYGSYDVVKLDDSEFAAISGLNEVSTKQCELLFINPENGFVYRSNEGIPNLCPSSSVIHYLETGEDEKSIDEWNRFDENTPALDDDYLPGALFVGNELLINADEEVADLEFVGSSNYEDKPCVSFNCLVNLVEDKVITSTSAREKILGKAKIEIIDFSTAETRKISKSLQERLSAARKSSNFRFLVWGAKQTPPAPGFSLVDGSPAKWHKSATVLIRHGKRTFLMGQDEGTYFGCILADNPSSIDAAYVSLMPKEARGVKGVLRQGEWFAIPVQNQKSVPDQFSPETILWTDINNDNTALCFGIEDDNSNHHHFTGEVIITKDGRYFARNFEIHHDEHAVMRGENDVWYNFARNTAKASYSAERVD